MLKKIAILIAVLLVPVFVLSSGDSISSDNWSYKDIKSLVDSGIITKPLTKDTLTRAEVVEYINDGVQNVFAANKTQGSASSSDVELLGQIDKLYNLVKAYMTDMMRTEQKLDSILETIGDLKVKKEQIEKRQDRLLNAMGMRINGESSAYMTDVLLYGSHFKTLNQTVLRYRPITQFLDLKFSLNATKELYAEATFRLENVYGGFWGSMDIYGLKRFFIQGQYPVAFIFGDYQAKLTPFTLWAVDDERPNEAKIFSDKRDMNKKELYLIDNSWPLSGAKVQTIVELFDTVDVDITMMGARLGEAGKPTSGYQKYNVGTGLFAPTTYSHDQYLIAGRIGTGIAEMFSIGLNMSEIVDSKDTGASYVAPALDNTVYSVNADGKVKFADSMEASIKAEYAMSNYTYSKGFQNYISGKALKGEAEVKGFDSKINAIYSSVDNLFTSYASQTRMYDEKQNYDYLTQNNSWNINPNPPNYPTYNLGGVLYPFSKYRPTINVSYGATLTSTAGSGVASAKGNLYFATIYDNNTLPYGDSTPNRKTIRVKYSGNYLEGLIQPSVSYIIANELVSALPLTFPVSPRKFSVIEGGLKSEFTAGIPFAVMLGYKMEDTNNGQKNSIAFTSTTIDAGLEATIIKKKFKTFVGYKSTAFEGYEYTLNKAVYSFDQYDKTIDSIGVGFEYYVAKPAVIGMSFTTTSIHDLRKGNDPILLIPYKNLYSYNAQELDIKVSISF